mmetsp:Transcript_82719/g.177252  ORF Transcript_82719/g.177252 Transcript_82719/m.177252 type:complete len:545 (-) Transcript_82719:57-1691(-)
MAMAMLVRIALAYISVSMATVAAAEQCLQGDLALLQTIIRVDESDTPAVVETVSSSRPVSKLHGDARLTKVFIGVAVITMIIACGRFHQTLNAPPRSKKDDDGKLDAISIISPGAGGNAGPMPTAPEKKEPDRMAWSTFILGILFTMLECFATAQYVPQMPEMATSLGCSQTDMGITLQINWVVKAVFALIVGPLSDRVGRKPILALGCFLLSLSSFACSSTKTVMWFYAARAIQGIGEGAEGVIRSTYRDVYDDMKDRVRIGSASIVVTAIAPMVAPTIGGVLTERTGSWRSSFVLFGMLGFLLTLAIVFFFKETLPSREEGAETSVMQDFSKIVSDRHLVVILAIGVFVFVQGGAAASSNAFIFEEGYHKTPLFFARISALNSVIGIFGVGFGNVLASKFSPLIIMRIFMSAWALIACVQFVLTLTSLINSVWFYLGCFWITMFMGVPIAMAMGPLYMEQMKHSSGMAGGVQCAVSNLFGSILAHCLTYIIAPNGASGMMIVSSACSVFTVAFFWLGFGLNPPSWARGDAKANSEGGAVMGH